MESVSNKNFKTSLVEEDLNLSTFRKRNNILILILIFFTISLAIIIGFSFFYTVHTISDQSDQPLPLNRAIQTYYLHACNTPSCLDIFDPIVGSKSITDPNQIFILSLQTAAQQLEKLISSFMLSNSNTESAYTNCSDSLRDGFRQIQDALATMRVNPFVERLSDEQWSKMMNLSIAAQGNLRSCVDDLAKVETTTVVSQVRENVVRVKEYLSSGEQFLWRYNVAEMKLWRDIAAPDWRSVILGYLFIVCVCVFYLWCIFYFCRTLFRFLGVKSPPPASVFRPLRR